MRAAGFTLIEMLVVLTILSLVAALAIGTLGKRPDIGSRLQTERAVRAAIETARREARATGRPQDLALDQAAKGQPLMATGDQPIRFYPDGSSSGGTIALGTAALVSVDWLTGGIDDPR